MSLNESIDWLVALGRIHPLILHLPIGVFAALALLHLVGRDQIIDWLRAGLGQFENTDPKHFFANHVFDIDGDVAHTRSYMHGLTPHIGGLYEIEHHRTAEGWRIADLRLMHFSSNPLPKA